MDRLPEHLTPVFMNYLLAKSRDNGGDTLAQHTWQVICRLSDQYRIRPNLSMEVGDERLWHRLYWACFLHDFGKAAQGFQERLADHPPENEWQRGKHRHEVLSLAFINWLFPRGHVDRLPVICAVVSHHKDAEDILGKYGGRGRKSDERRRIEFLISQVSPQVIKDLWLWLEQYGTTWLEAVGLPILEFVSPRNYEAFGVEAICQALDEFNEYRFGYEDGLYDAHSTLLDIHYRGLILTSDHAASAGTPPFPPLTWTPEQAAGALKGYLPRSHQLKADQSGDGSALMIAPTGSGKTEAALLWAARQMQHRPTSRLFYTLPYQASMNAMEKRLKEKFFNDSDGKIVTIQHSRATLKFYQDLMDVDGGANPRTVTRAAKARKNLAQLNYFPVQVFSPYQMLKAAYSLKGYETLLVDYTNALFIFDEIHAYDPSRLALIITFIGWLAEHFNARFLVMTATMPPLIETRLRKALRLQEQNIITADQQVFEESRRHEVHILDGDLLDHLDHIAQEGRQKKVLVCCNQVARAQEAYKRLQRDYGFTRENSVLLHGRFNGKDRSDKEVRLGELVGVGTPKRPYVVVATQVVEVSLNIDLDTIYTDPAPLEALLQRFGRVNRGRSKREVCPVHIFREPMGEKECKPYKLPEVRESLNVLEGFQGKTIDESLVTAMLGEIYEHEAIKQTWEANYDRAAREFTGVLERMQPYQSADPSTFQAFYKLFDGTQVLPVDCENDYDDAVERNDYLGASQFLVNVSWGQHAQISIAKLNKGRNENEYADRVDIPYSEEWGLDIAGALKKQKAEFKDEDV